MQIVKKKIEFYFIFKQTIVFKNNIFRRVKFNGNL
jgi:hypothetical protein